MQPQPYLPILSGALSTVALIFTVVSPARAVALNQYQQLAIPATDVVADGVSQRVFVSVGANGAGDTANSITAINPSTGAIDYSVPIGANPVKMAASNDGKFVYVAINGGTDIARFNIATHTVESPWSLGSDSFYGKYYVEDFDVMPEHPNTVAVSLRNMGFSPRNMGVAIFDDGVRRATSTAGSNNIDFADANTLYGYNNETSDFGLNRMTVDAGGVQTVETQHAISGFFGPLRYFNGCLFRGADCINVPSWQRRGTFSGASGEPTYRNNRVFYVTSKGLEAFDLTTFRRVGGLTAPTGSDLVRWGSDGYAWRTSNNVIIARSDLATRTLPAPSPLPAARTIRTNVRVFDARAMDLIYNPSNNRLIASLPVTHGANGNSIVVLNPRAGTSEAPITVGSDPTNLALSDDGSTLYTVLSGAGTLRRVNLLTRIANATWSLGNSGLGAYRAEDIAVLPGRTDAVAVSLVRPEVSPRQGGVAIFAKGVRLPQSTGGSNRIEFTGPGQLIGYNNETSEFGVQKMAVADDGVTTTKTLHDLFIGSGDIRYGGGRLYHSNGTVMDVATEKVVGTIAGGSICPDPALGKVFVLTQPTHNSGAVIRIFDITTLQELGQISVPEVTGTVDSLVRWGQAGLAFRAVADSVDPKPGGQIWLIESDLVGVRARLTLTLNPARFLESAGANASQATLTRNTGINSALTVNLSASASGLTIPAQVTIPAGQTSVTFPVGAVNNSKAAGMLTVTIQASATGVQPAQAVAQVLDDEAVLTVSVQPSTFSESATPRGATGTVTRSFVGSTQLVVSLTSSDVSEATVPATITIPAGQISVTFPIHAVDDSIVDGSQQVVITASHPNWQSQSAMVTVTDDDAANTGTEATSQQPKGSSSATF